MPHTEPDQPVSPALATPEFAPPGGHSQGILYGPLGLRAGWGIALYTVIAAILIFLCFTGIFTVTGQMKRLKAEHRQAHEAKKAADAKHQPVLDVPLAPLDSGLAEFAQAIAVISAAVLLGIMEKRRFGAYGLARRNLKDLLPGAVIGIASITLLVGSLRALHLLVFDVRLLQGTSILRYAAAWLVVFVCVGLFEEFFFRGYIQFTLMRGVLRLGERLAPAHARLAAFWIAALIWSLLFGATHLGNGGENAAGIAAVFAAGIVFSYALWRTGSLWWGIGFHTTWDWGQSFLYGVPDSGHVSLGRLFATHTSGNVLLSGGTAGPEGSLLVLPVLALVAVAIRLHPQAVQPEVEPTSLPLAAQPSALGRLP